MGDSGEEIVVREAVVADAPAISAIGSVGFPAIHNELVGEKFAAAVVEQTYSISALTECISRCALADDAVFLSQSATGRWSDTCTTTAKVLSQSCIGSMSISTESAAGSGAR